MIFWDRKEVFKCHGVFNCSVRMKESKKSEEIL